MEMEHVVQMSERDLFKMMEICAERGAMQAISRLGIEDTTITLRQSQIKYGRSNINNWIKMGYIHPIIDPSNGRKMIKLEEINALMTYDTHIRTISSRTIKRNGKK